MIIIGLGNPGKEYEKTRHNAGFLALDKIKDSWDFPDFKYEKKFNAEISASPVPFLLDGGNVRRADESADPKNRKVILVKPRTFMNESGASVLAILDFYKSSPRDILVIHDDLDIALGEIRPAADSRSAGHNGVQNIIDRLGTQKFRRIRIGIGKSPEKKSACPLSAHDYVLDKFSQEELDILEKIFEKIATEELKILK